jgi:iron transport multicopper oxidase
VSSSAPSSSSTIASSTASTPVATPSPSGPSHVKAVGKYNWIGCYTEASSMRALSSTSQINYNTMTGNCSFAPVL